MFHMKHSNEYTSNYYDYNFILWHILFIAYFDEFKTVSPLFNMEDRNIKKSFDVILLHTSEQAIYYTEVKSGSVKNERSDPKIINSSRKKRIANGSGTSIQEVNQLMKQFTQMSKMMKMMQGGGGKQMMQMMKGMK